MRKYVFGATKRFELQSVAAWIRYKHCGLFSSLPLETYAGFDQKLALGLLQLPDQFFPIAPLENHTKVGYRHIFPVYVICAFFV